MHKILLLEDDEILSQTLEAILEDEGFEVVLAKDGEVALDKSFEERFDLYLLDVNVPFLNGFDFLKELRDAGDRTPAFFVTALKDLGSISKGFDVGADDYIKKPFDLDELLIRVKSILKKQYDFLKYGDLEYDPLNNRILKENREIDLPSVEKMIFDLLVKNTGQTIHKDQFYDVMEKSSDQALRVHINKIKKTLNIPIVNIRGIGYRLEKP